MRRKYSAKEKKIHSSSEKDSAPESDDYKQNLKQHVRKKTRHYAHTYTYLRSKIKVQKKYK